MKLTIIGTGYVGLVSGACFAEMGNTVTCVDKDKKKINDLQKGVVPIYEPGLEDVVVSNIKGGRLRFATSIKDPAADSNIYLIAVGTPPDEAGSADLEAPQTVESAACGEGTAQWHTLDRHHSDGFLPLITRVTRLRSIPTPGKLVERAV